MNFCSRCRKPVGDYFDTHHLIPVALAERYAPLMNADLYRFILCKECHSMVTDAWRPIFKALGIRREPL